MRRLFVTLAAALALAGPAPGGVIFSTGFDGPPYVAGSRLPGVNAPPGFPLPPTDPAHPFHLRLSPDAAVIAAPDAVNGLTSQAVRVAGADLLPEPGGAPSYYLGLYRLPLGYDAAAAGLPTVRVQVDVRLDGPTLDQTDPDRRGGDAVSANLVGVSGDGDSFGEISLSADGHVYGYTDNDIYLFGVPVTLGEFHTLGLDIDFAARTTTFRLDGTAIGVYDFGGLITSNELDRVALVSYANLPESDAVRSDYVTYFDDLGVTAVPEPASLSLLVVGAGAAGLRRLRKGR